MAKDKKTKNQGASKRCVIISALSVIAVALCVLLGVLISVMTKRADLLTDDLSRFVTVPKSAYSGAEIKINKPVPNEADVSERAMLDLIDYKTTSDGALKTFGRLGVGDVINVKRITVYLADGTKLYESDEYSISGEKTKKHTVGEKFIINGYELSGVNFALEGSEVDCDLGNDTVSAYAYLPYSYPDLSLASSRVVVKVQLYGFINYDIPLLNDDFIENTLKISEKIKDFEGEKLVDKYISYLKAELNAEHGEAVEYLTEELIWAKLSSSAEIKKLPRGDVRDKYKAFVAELESAYASSGSGASLADFAREYLGLSSDADYKEYLKGEAERAVAGKIAFYAVLRAEGWMPGEAELAEYYGEALEERLDYYLKYEVFCLPEHYSTEAEYNSAVDAHKSELLAALGESYFTDEAYFRFGMEKLKTSVRITLAE